MSRTRTIAGCMALVIGAVGFIASHRLVWAPFGTGDRNVVHEYAVALSSLVVSALLAVIGVALLTPSRRARLTAAVFYALMAAPVLIGEVIIILNSDADGFSSEAEGRVGLGIWGILLGFITLYAAALVALITAIRIAYRAGKQIDPRTLQTHHELR